MKKKNIQIITLLALLLSPLIFLFAELFKIQVIYIKLDTIKSVLSTIIGASGSIVGFLVIYLSISFENFRRNYGQYGSKFFQSNSLILTFLGLLLLTILISFLAFLLIDSNSFFKIYLFNISCFYFFISLILLIPYGYLITKESSSVEILDKVIKSISINDFHKQKSKDISLFSLKAEAEKNNFILIGEILITNTADKNNRTASAIVIHLYERIEELLKDNKIDEPIKFNIVSSFCSLIKEVFYTNLNNKNNDGIIVCIASINSLDKIIAQNKYKKAFVKEIFELIGFICKSLIESENETLANKALWAYYHISKDQLYFNTPKEFEIWQKSDNPEFYALPLQTPEAFEKDSLFMFLEESISYQLNNIIERSFLCKNYHITEDCVNILSSFVEMIAWSQNLGDLQKHRIGSMLAFYSVSAIKRFSLIDTGNRTNYMGLYLGNSFVVDLLKENTLFSKSVFSNYIDLLDYLYTKDKLFSYELEKCIGLGRLIVAYSSQIPTSYDNLKFFLEVLSKIKHKTTSTEIDKEIVDIAKKGIQSFLSIMTMRNIQSSELKDLVLKYV